MKAIDVTRVKRTNGGHEVRIYYADETVIHGAVLLECKWQLSEWMIDGRMKWASSLLDLVEEPETVEVDGWVNVRLLSDGIVLFGKVYATPDNAREFSDSSCIACIRIQRTVTKGEGLDVK